MADELKKQAEVPAIYKRINAIMGDIGAIGKDSRNTMQNYNFRGIDQVYNELHGLLTKYDVFTIPEVLEDIHEERRSSKGGLLIYRILKMKYTFMCSHDGSSFDTIVIGEGMDSGDKASNKAMAVAHKYALLQVFCIPTEETKDPENNSHKLGDNKKTPPPPPPPKKPAPPKILPPEQSEINKKNISVKMLAFKTLTGLNNYKASIRKEVGLLQKQDKEDLNVIYKMKKDNLNEESKDAK